MVGIVMPVMGSTGGQQVAAVDPDEIPSLNLWYYPSQNTAARVTVNGSNEVTAINDLSGSGHPANSLNARYPTYATNVLNGAGGVLFTRANEDNSDINPIAWAQNQAGFTIYVVARPTILDGSAFPLVNTNSNLGIAWNGSAWQIGAATGLATATVTNDTANAHIYGMIFDGSATGNANRLRFRYDKQDIALTFSSNPGTATSGAESSFYFCGNRRNAPNQYMNGYLFEVMIWLRALRPSEIRGVETYLTQVIGASVVTPITSGLTYHIDIGNSASYPGSGVYAADLAGSGAGNTSVAAGYVSAGAGSYLTTDGATQWMLTPNLASKFNSPSNITFTIEVWVKTSADNGVIVSEQGTVPVHTGWHDSLMEIVGGNLRVSVWQPSNGSSNLLVGAVTRNVWQQYVMTYDGTTLKGYINAGTPTSMTVTRAVPWNYGAPGLYYGLFVYDTTSLGDGSWLAGNFGQFKLYNRALTAAEVLQNFNATKTTYGL